MAYRCKNCGKFVTKDAKVCKFCGQENPAEEATKTGNKSSQKNNSGPNMQYKKNSTIQCPHCGGVLSLPKEVENEPYLHCNLCNRKFSNPNTTLGRSENFLRKHGCLITIGVIIIIFVIGLFTGGWENPDDRISADGQTVYIITEDIYAPINEDIAKAMISSMAKNGTNDPMSMLEFQYKYPNGFTHVFKDNKVIVLKKTSSGYLIRKLKDMQTAVVPNANYLKEN